MEENQKIEELEKRVEALEKKMAELKQAAQPNDEKVDDWIKAVLTD